MGAKWKLYTVKDDKVERKSRFCPRCGEGVFMAEHRDRFSCGNCGYTIWKSEK